jgi:hypothetical protein
MKRQVKGNVAPGATSPKNSMYDILKKCASNAFNYPSIKICSDGDIITYLNRIKMSGIFKKSASDAFNYPSIKLCSGGDIITYLKMTNI